MKKAISKTLLKEILTSITKLSTFNGSKDFKNFKITNSSFIIKYETFILFGEINNYDIPINLEVIEEELNLYKKLLEDKNTTKEDCIKKILEYLNKDYSEEEFYNKDLENNIFSYLDYKNIKFEADISNNIKIMKREDPDIKIRIENKKVIFYNSISEIKIKYTNDEIIFPSTFPKNIIDVLTNKDSFELYFNLEKNEEYNITGIIFLFKLVNQKFKELSIFYRTKDFSLI